MPKLDQMQSVRVRNRETVFVTNLHGYGYIPTRGKRFIYILQNYLAGVFVKADRPVMVQVIQDNIAVGEFRCDGSERPGQFVECRMDAALKPLLKEGPTYVKALFRKQGICYVAVGLWQITGKRMSRKRLGRRIVLRRAKLIMEDNEANEGGK